MKATHRICAGLAALLAMSLAIPSSAQVGGGFDPAALRQWVMGQMQEQLGFTDEEWSVVEPKLWRVAGLQLDSNTGPLGELGRGGRGGGRGGRGGLANVLSQLFNNGQPSSVAAKSQLLQAAINDPNTTTRQFRLLLADYRAAVAKSREQLAAAQKELQNVLTVRQEAALMQAGLLE